MEDKKYEVVYLVNESYGKLPTFDTKEEGYAFIDGLTWNCKINPDKHPCESCNAEFDVFEVDQPLERIPEETKSKEKFTSEDKLCPYCGGNISGNCCGDRVVYWCEKCGANNKVSPPNISVKVETPTNGEETKSQSGEREEKIVKEKLRRELPIGAYTDLYEEVTDNKEERILGYVTCGERVLDDYARIVAVMLSESKKEGIMAEREASINDYEVGFNDGWGECCRENKFENDARRLEPLKEKNSKRFREAIKDSLVG